MSALGGKADMTSCGCLLSRSLSGAKRTYLFAPHMSAFDPKRISPGKATVLRRYGNPSKMAFFFIAIQENSIVGQPKERTHGASPTSDPGIRRCWV
jgi:hypothetical protein